VTAIVPDAVPQPPYLRTLADGTVKQVNPFTGTEVWTVARRARRPLRADALAPPRPLDPAHRDRACPFCPARHRETPPERARMVRSPGGVWTHLDRPTAEVLDIPAEFRRIPNLFETLSLDYWRGNYGYEPPAPLLAHQAAYLASPGGWDHAAGIVGVKMRAMGMDDGDIAGLTEEELREAMTGFFASGHDVILARRHYLDSASDEADLAGAGSLTPEEHERFIAFTVAGARDLAEANPFARYVAVFQNWLRPAGASLDHLHKQIVAIDSRGPGRDAEIARAAADPQLYNKAAANYAIAHDLVIAENDHAVAFAGFGHRYPAVEVYSTSEASNPWDHAPGELRGMSDLLHAVHAATGASRPTNEEWHYRPLDTDTPMPWRIAVKWRVSTLAGFEGATKIYLNTIPPAGVKSELLPVLTALRDDGKIAADLRIGSECSGRENPLRARC
jgi:galactose-1-phosphate uridylyltransferase